jgi:Zn-dependent protease with chaperone function
MVPKGLSRGGHPLDRLQFSGEALLIRDLSKQFGLEPLIDHFIESGDAAPLYQVVMAEQLRLTAALDRRVLRLLKEAQDALEFHELVDVFVFQHPNINAFALQSLEERVPHAISLTSAMIEKMNDPELKFAIGHELGQPNRMQIFLDFFKWRLRGKAEGKWAVVGIVIVAASMIIAAVILQ